MAETKAELRKELEDIKEELANMKEEFFTREKDDTVELLKDILKLLKKANIEEQYYWDAESVKQRAESLHRELTGDYPIIV